MSGASRALLVVALTLGAAACSASDKGTPTPAGTRGPGTTAKDTGIIGRTKSAECPTDFDTVSVAVEAYQALRGKLPATEHDLVAAGLLRETSKLYDISPQGDVVPTPGGLCA